jgi:DNA polymerase
MMPTVYGDVETCSRCNLKDCGAHIYAVDPTTDVIYLCFAIDDGPVETWQRGDPVPAPFANPAGHRFVFDNWTFEQLILEHVLIPRYGFAPIPIEQQDCAQRRALACAFPAELGLRCQALDLPYTKDIAARRAMLRLSRMHDYKRPEDRERDLALLLQRCKTDVEATRAAYNNPRLRPLLPEERQQLLLDARINSTGICANVPFLKAAQTFTIKERNAIDARLAELTGGTVTSLDQVERLKDAINACGHKMKTLGKRSVAGVLAHQPDDLARELLELRQRGAYASTRKFKKLLDHAGPSDARIRGALRIYGGAPGRWSSLGAQLHNLMRNDAEFPASLVDALTTGNVTELERFGNPLKVIGQLSRAALCAAPGHELICADFGAIESRVVAWFAGEEWKLDIFQRYDATGDKTLEPYRVVAARMLHKDINAIAAADRQKGKSAELACGFGGSIGAWRRIANDEDVRSDAEVGAIVKAWRNAHPKIKTFWDRLMKAARISIRTKQAIRVMPVSRPSIITDFDGTDFTITLPSGRAINYPGARLTPNNKFENSEADIEFFDNARGQWKPARAWFGTLVENAVQGTARDLLAAAIIRAEARGWKVVFHCHDELVIEAPTGAIPEKDVLALLLEPPTWATGLPLGGKVHSGPLYLEAPATAEPPSETSPHVESAGEIPDSPAPAAREAPKFSNDADEADNSPPWENGDDRAEQHDGDPDQSDHDGNGRGDFGSFEHGERDDIGDAVDEFFYRNLKGALHLKIVKRVTKSGKKSFPQYHLDNGQWVKGKPAGPKIPYRLPELLAAPASEPVIPCEGEKDADNGAAIGLVTTTNSEGAGKWTNDLNMWFAGKQAVYIAEDNDDAGRAHARQVAYALQGIVPDVRIVSFPELPEHGDLSDWIAQGGTKKQFLERAQAAPKFIALESVCATNVEIEDYDWVWPDRFALKKIGLVVGLPDEGKGLLLSDIIARITRAAEWPCGEGRAPLGNVILLTAEDDISDTIVPRLIAADADLNRVHIIKMMHEAGAERMFSLITDLNALRQKIVEVGNVIMVVIDPISAYLGIGKIDSFRATDVRAVLGPLKDLAESLRVSVIGIMHFNKKTDVTNVLLRISDSLAYGAASRHVYGVINDPDNFRRLFVRGKNNVAKAEQKTLAFSIDERDVGTDKRTGKVIRRPYIAWHDEPVDITATEALQAAAENKSPSARDNAKHFVEALLSNGPVGSSDVQEAAKENGISARTLHRAQKDLGVDIKQDGPINEKGHRTWRWHLPTK